MREHAAAERPDGITKASRFRGVSKANGGTGPKPWTSRISVTKNGNLRSINIGTALHPPESLRMVPRTPTRRLLGAGPAARGAERAAVGSGAAAGAGPLPGPGGLERAVVGLAAAATVLLGGPAGPAAASPLTLFGEPNLRDPIEPFVLYGNIYKKYLIEVLEGTKVVSRKKGFTANACVNAIKASQETPDIVGLPNGLKVSVLSDPDCTRKEGDTLPSTCAAACSGSCRSTMARFQREEQAATGYQLLPEDKERMERRCTRSCRVQCLKEGNATSFAVPSR